MFDITKTDTASPEAPARPEGWFQLYKALHHRESNWRRGLAQSIDVMEGHKGFVTSLKKCGDIVITGSYDETVKIWSAVSGRCQKTIHVQGSIACLDYLASENIIACGCHDVGRVYVVSARTGERSSGVALRGALLHVLNNMGIARYPFLQAPSSPSSAGITKV